MNDAPVSAPATCPTKPAAPSRPTIVVEPVRYQTCT